MLKVIEVEKTAENIFVAYLSDDSYVVVTSEDMATLLLSRKGKPSIAFGKAPPTSRPGIVER
jgi:hypothetical protein